MKNSEKNEKKPIDKSQKCFLSSAISCCKREKEMAFNDWTALIEK